jgi:O-antigen/teichoic acid export membrane protein
MLDDPTGTPQTPPTLRSFVANVNVVAVTYALDAALALATAALTARALGADGRGTYALIILSAGVAQLVLGLGAGNAAIYYLNRREMRLADVVSAMHVVVIASLAVTATVVAITAPLAGDAIFGDEAAAWMLIPLVPVLLHMSLMRLVLQALDRFTDIGVVTVGQQTLLLAMIILAMALGDPGPVDILALLVIAWGLSSTYALGRIGFRYVDIAQIRRPNVAVLRTLAQFGMRGEAGNILQAVNYRFDQYIVKGFSGSAAVGIYAVGASLSEGVFILANAVALVLMPRLAAAEPDEAARVTPVACRNTLLIALAAAAAVGALAPFAIPLIFGDAFERSVQAVWWLLPGTVLLCGSKVLTSYFFSQGRPGVNTGITAVSLAITLGADFALIPAYGVNGAAAASSVGYAAHFAAALYFWRRISGLPAADAVLPRLSDASLYGEALRSVLSRGRAPARAEG